MSPKGRSDSYLRAMDAESVANGVWPGHADGHRPAGSRRAAASATAIRAMRFQGWSGGGLYRGRVRWRSTARTVRPTLFPSSTVTGASPSASTLLTPAPKASQVTRPDYRDPESAHRSVPLPGARPRGSRGATANLVELQLPSAS